MTYAINARDAAGVSLGPAPERWRVARAAARTVPARAPASRAGLRPQSPDEGSTDQWRRHADSGAAAVMHPSHGGRKCRFD
ncbi:protein of unknown function [Burkholderia multivorans]